MRDVKLTEDDLNLLVNALHSAIDTYKTCVKLAPQQSRVAQQFEMQVVAAQQLADRLEQL